jgi:hypothetical protein
MDKRFITFQIDMEKELESAQIVGRIKNLSNVNGNTVRLLDKIYIKLRFNGFFSLFS